jgi:excinuclease ABC subunit C
VLDYLRLPHEPGCYLYKDKRGNIIYIGKAKDLKKRVTSYFKRFDLDPKTTALVRNIDSVDFIITKNEKEALILENNLIKKNQPKYNIDLRDSKRFAYILLTKEDYPRLVIARKKLDEGRYFGPFVSAEKRDSILYFANNVFRLRTCRKLPKRKCVRFDIGRCLGPCIKETRIEYSSAVEDALKLLSGKDSPLLSDLQKRMADASKKQDYEAARGYRDQITALAALQEKQNMETARRYDQDVINYIVTDSIVHLAVFNIYSGILASKADYEFDYKEDFQEEFLLQYYSDNQIPKEIILPAQISQALKSHLSDLRGTRVVVTVPERGEKKELLDLVKRNVEKDFLDDELNIRDLKDKLNLENIPKIIECFDISHLSGTDTVGSMIRFSNGKPDKNNYRRFRIRSVDGVDDPKAIAEVVKRRYTRLIEENKALPDLIVIDGGITQLNAAFQQLRDLKIKIPIIGLAKKEEEIYIPGLTDTLKLDKKSRALHLLQKIRDEAHRFAVKYHKVLRKKRVLGDTKAIREKISPKLKNKSAKDLIREVREEDDS